MATYDTDFAAWAAEQAERLRHGPRDALDWDNLAEEIESLGRSERKALESHLARLITHLLKWHHQPERRSRSWVATVRHAQRQVARRLGENPSLRSRLDDVLAEAWQDGRDVALIETDLPSDALPADLPWTFDDLMRDGGPDGTCRW